MDWIAKHYALYIYWCNVNPTAQATVEIDLWKGVLWSKAVQMEYSTLQAR